MSKNYIAPITMLTFNSTGLTGGFDLVGVLSHSCSILRISNGCKVPVIISYDGATNHDFIFPEGNTLLLNLQANSMPNGKVSMIKKGTPIYVKGTASTGLIYISGYYNPNN